MPYAEWKKPDSEGRTPYDPIYMTFGKRKNHQGRGETGGCQGWGWREGRLSTKTQKGIFQGERTVLYLNWDDG